MKWGTYKEGRLFAVANSTRKMRWSICQRRKLIARSIAPGCIFFNKTGAAPFSRAKNVPPEGIPCIRGTNASGARELPIQSGMFC